MRRVLSRRIMPDTPPVEKKDYLCVEFPTGGYISLTGSKPATMDYVAFSKDGRNWTKYTSNGSMSANAGEKIYVKGSGSESGRAMGIADGEFGWKFNVRPTSYSTTPVSNYAILSGNIMSLLYDDDFEDKLEVPASGFAGIFSTECYFKDVSALKLPATTVGNYAYARLFGSINSGYVKSKFTTPPKLPATTLGAYCYIYMFRYVTTLEEMPELPATTLASYCYHSMFQGCSIKEAKVLPATTLTPYCYNSMFSMQGSAIHIPHNMLPAMTLADYCYTNMFSNCSLLKYIPADLLPATTLTQSCYAGMFTACPKLEFIPDTLLPATTLAQSCYSGMFRECNALVRVPRNLLPATILAPSCYSFMFGNCVSLKNIPATLLPATTHIDEVSGQEVTSLESSCYANMFTYCTSLTSIPSTLLPATKLASACYTNMFMGCSSLKKIPEGFLPATTLAYSCYDSMFKSCRALTSLDYQLVPVGAHAAPYCFEEMFRGCTSLSETIKSLTVVDRVSTGSHAYMFADCESLKNTITFDESLNAQCYQFMYSGCTSLTDAEDLPATSIEVGCYGCYRAMFQGCTSLVKAPKISATDFDENECCAYMFSGCTSLKDLPKLVINGDSNGKVAKLAFDHAFSGCTSLEDISNIEFNAEYLDTQSFNGMFNGCIALQTLPENCSIHGRSYSGTSYSCQLMFAGCTSLKTIPDLPDVAGVQQGAYKAMFQGCTGLETLEGSSLPLLELSYSVYESMFQGCTSLETVPADFIKANDFRRETCCKAMFKGCTSLKVAPYINPSVSYLSAGGYAFQEMFEGCYKEEVVEGETVYTGLTRMAYLPGESQAKLPFTSIGTYSYGSMFKNCKALTEVPLLYITGSGAHCCDSMFEGCDSLTSLPRYLLNGVISYSTSSWAYRMFANCKSLNDIPQKIFDGQTTQGLGYQEMFAGCTELVTAPELPVAASGSSYNGMFMGCSKLKNAPVLSSTNPRDSYVKMFKDCIALETAPALPATSDAGYTSMFEGCTSLKSCPEMTLGTGINCTTMFKGCTALTSYADVVFRKESWTATNMFQGCTSLVGGSKEVEGESVVSTIKGKDMVATDMFNGCSALTSVDLDIQIEDATHTAQCQHMFRNCGNLVTASGAITGVFTESGFDLMFAGCVKLTTAPTLTISGAPKRYCMVYMFQNCSSLEEVEGTIHVTGRMDYAFHYMFDGCKVLTSHPTFTIDTDTVGEQGYMGMFKNCEALKTIPASLLRGVTTLGRYCYKCMFQGCKSLTSIPADILPATTLANECYAYMFNGCSGITSLPDGLLPAPNDDGGACYKFMFAFTSITEVKENLTALTVINTYNLCESMFEGCSQLTKAYTPKVVRGHSACYQRMFANCRNLAEIHSMLNPNGQSYYTYLWVNGVSNTGVFYTDIPTHWPRNSANGIPYGWTVEYVND